MRIMHIIPLILFSVIIAFAIVSLLENKNTLPQSRMIGKEIPSFELPIALEKDKTLKIESLRGKYFLLNIFASWCITCKVEHPSLMAIKKQNIIPIYGIDWKDSAEELKKLLDKSGNPYEKILDDKDGKAIIALGVTGAPESFLISPEGKILVHYMGPITDEIFKNEIMPIIGVK